VCRARVSHLDPLPPPREDVDDLPHLSLAAEHRVDLARLRTAREAEDLHTDWIRISKAGQTLAEVPLTSLSLSS